MQSVQGNAVSHHMQLHRARLRGGGRTGHLNAPGEAAGQALANGPFFTADGLDVDVYTNVMPMETQVRSIIRIVSELPFTIGCPVHVDMVSEASPPEDVLSISQWLQSHPSSSPFRGKTPACRSGRGDGSAVCSYRLPVGRLAH